MLLTTIILLTLIINITSFVLKPNKFATKLNAVQYEEYNDPDKSITKLNHVYHEEYKPKFEYFEYDENKETYTIISVDNERTKNLIKDIKLNRINYVYIDIHHFTYNQVLEICKYYSVNYTPSFYQQPNIFLGPDYYIGSTFEMYEIISKS
jgi:hypothetical protein